MIFLLCYRSILVEHTAECINMDTCNADVVLCYFIHKCLQHVTLRSWVAQAAKHHTTQTLPYEQNTMTLQSRCTERSIQHTTITARTHNSCYNTTRVAPASSSTSGGAFQGWYIMSSWLRTALTNLTLQSHQHMSHAAHLPPPAPLVAPSRAGGCNHLKAGGSSQPLTTEHNPQHTTIAARTNVVTTYECVAPASSSTSGGAFQGWYTLSSWLRTALSN
jgi:hypothetical protein